MTWNEYEVYELTDSHVYAKPLMSSFKPISFQDFINVLPSMDFRMYDLDGNKISTIQIVLWVIHF
jgi:hypothetical protein